MKNMRALLAITLLLGMVLTACGQPLPEPANVIALYEGVAPGSEGWDWEERNLQSRAGLPITQNVVKPVLMYYPPDPATDVGTAMVIAPGGGFRSLMMSYEGVDVARYLNKLGVPVYAAAGSKWGLPIAVPEDAPPLCIFTAANDQVIPWERSVELFAEWKKAGFLAELHIFQAGKHGFRETGGGADHYLDRLQEWMKVNGWLSKGP
jgi:acetyl esterase/lipase